MNDSLRDLIKQRLSDLLDQKDMILDELDEIEQMLVPEVYNQLILEITSEIVYLTE